MSERLMVYSSTFQHLVLSKTASHHMPNIRPAYHIVSHFHTNMSVVSFSNLLLSQHMINKELNAMHGNAFQYKRRQYVVIFTC